MFEENYKSILESHYKKYYEWATCKTSFISLVYSVDSSDPENFYFNKIGLLLYVVKLVKCRCRKAYLHDCLQSSENSSSIAQLLLCTTQSQG